MYRRIRDLREDRDMTQVQIAALLHCSQRIYSNYERGDVDIRARLVPAAGGEGKQRQRQKHCHDLFHVVPHFFPLLTAAHNCVPGSRTTSGSIP